MYCYLSLPWNQWQFIRQVYVFKSTGNLLTLPLKHSGWKAALLTCVLPLPCCFVLLAFQTVLWVIHLYEFLATLRQSHMYLFVLGMGLLSNPLYILHLCVKMKLNLLYQLQAILLSWYLFRQDTGSRALHIFLHRYTKKAQPWPHLRTGKCTRQGKAFRIYGTQTSCGPLWMIHCTVATACGALAWLLMDYAVEFYTTTGPATNVVEEVCPAVDRAVSKAAHNFVPFWRSPCVLRCPYLPHASCYRMPFRSKIPSATTA